MSGAARAFYGAVIGGLLTLLVHPLSRPFLATTFTKFGASESITRSYWLVENHSKLSTPSNTLEASLWMEAGARKLRTREGADPEELDGLISAARGASEEDPENAFWRQMEAVFLSAKGDKIGAWAAWRKAANLARWDDLQSRRLSLIADDLARVDGASMAWHYAAAYPMRSYDAVDLIQLLAREIVRSADLTSPEGLRLRYATLMNGKLIREGGRHLDAAQVGMSMVELSSYPPDMGGVPTPRRLLLARNGLYNALLKAGMEQEATSVWLQFQENDGWTAMTSRDTPQEHLGWLALGALAVATLPGSMLLVGLLGGAMWGVSVLFREHPALLRVVQPPLAPILGVALAAVVYAYTRLSFAAVAVASCFAFLTFTPVHERSRPSADLGPLYSLTLFLLGTVFAAFVLAFWVGVSSPGFHILSLLRVPQDYYGGAGLFVGLAGIVLGLLLLVAPSWAIVQRIPTPRLVTLTLHRFGRGLCIACVTGALLLAPFCIYADMRIGTHLRSILQNEPVYYVNQ